ncbi:MT-A70-domain-containing protein [Dacryopinax primogenitus]|uniref:mRNA m(6)A methyltransferase n=1 Tax=Dacryopinax primogenitus (strain DJM 731) TaxID=1858805 RepID=M5GGT4_DACPD|nr:MT-A70-domain-containing protein [Dacryopinax primogenitus]EJU06043.1 MT-A70-domain-containing protein [Dacryopinax primogenitus]
MTKLETLKALVQRGTARSKLLAERFHSPPGAAFEPLCPHITKLDCAKSRQQATGSFTACPLVHFRPILRPHTDPSLGHCSYLNTCYSEPSYALSPSIGPPPARPSGSVYLPSGLGAGGRGKEKAPCRYLHFEVDYDGEEPVSGGVEQRAAYIPALQVGRRPPRIPEEQRLPIGRGPNGTYSTHLLPPQWINCDLRKFEYSILGKFHVIMADPPWDIHMSLPYGTMTDDEMRTMPLPSLQDEGLIFLWVTGRAMEVGRECLRVWGYTRVDEIIWLKINQLQRVIRTGRTGHWLNHTKEHLLVGLKAPHDPSGALIWPSWINRGLDTDVIVSEVRETSRKPDEVYGLIERMCPGGRKIEIFGRKHNARPGWITLGNQLGSDQIHEPDLGERMRQRYVFPLSAQFRSLRSNFLPLTFRGFPSFIPFPYAVFYSFASLIFLLLYSSVTLPFVMS